jgi:hypothetical protein
MATCVLDNRTPRTVVRTGSCIATFCFASSQMITWTNCERRFQQAVPPLADLILRKFWLLASPNECDKVGFTKHLYRAYSGVEVCHPFKYAQDTEGGGIYLERRGVGMVLN